MNLEQAWRKFGACKEACRLSAASSVPTGFTGCQVSSHLAVVSYLSPAMDQVQSEDHTAALLQFNDLRMVGRPLEFVCPFDKWLDALDDIVQTLAD